MADNARAVARTSTLSRRWRSLPWPEIHNVFLDVGNFLRRSNDDKSSPLQHVMRLRLLRRRRRPVWKQNQHDATAAFTDALARFLDAPASRRVVETLRLRFTLTSRRGHARRIGELVGAAAAAGVVRDVEFELFADMDDVEAERTNLGYGERFGQFRHDCPGAFRCLTNVILVDLWFHDAAELNGLVRGCDALVLLSLNSGGFFPAMDDGGGDAPRRPPLVIDAPQSRLQTLYCKRCHIGGVELVQAPALVVLRYRAIDVVEDSAPISFGSTPWLRGLNLGHYQDEHSFLKLKLSELLVNGGGQLQALALNFENGKMWLQPEGPKQLKPALRRLTYLALVNIAPGSNLSWATFLLEAAPFLYTLDITICNHICMNSWHEKGDEDASLAWEPSPDFRHHHLKQLCFKRAFHVEKDLPFARLVMGLAVNLQAVTLGVKSLGCPGCIDAQRKYPDLARSRLRFTEGSEYVDEFVKKLKDGIATSAKITLLLSDLV